MFGSFGIFGVFYIVVVVLVCVLCFPSWGHCDTIAAFEPGITTYSWIIPPISPAKRRQSQSTTADNESPSITAPVGGYGHPPFYLRHSHEQLSLPNEFLITPLGDPHQQQQQRQQHTSLSMSQQPIFQQFDPIDVICQMHINKKNKPLMNQNQVDCDGKPSYPNVDISSAQQQQQQQQHATTMQMHQSNIAPVYTHQDHRGVGDNDKGSRGQPVSWPSSLTGSGGIGGIGLLFFVPDSASHLPVEQLIRQQLALHRTQLPFDISINCGNGDVSTRCLSGSSSGDGIKTPSLSYSTTTGTAATMTSSSSASSSLFNGRNMENGNYASPPLFDIVNSSDGSQQRKWRTLGERIIRNNKHQQKQQQQQQQHHQEMSILS